VNISLGRWPAIACVIGLCAVVASGCAVVPDGDYGWPGYYEPVGGALGGWGPGYLVGPVGGGGYLGGGGGFGGGQHAFRGAPTTGSVPSIPVRAVAAVRVGVAEAVARVAAAVRDHTDRAVAKVADDWRRTDQAGMGYRRMLSTVRLGRKMIATRDTTEAALAGRSFAATPISRLRCWMRRQGSRWR